jgi:hypothetical protein
MKGFPRLNKLRSEKQTSLQIPPVSATIDPTEDAQRQKIFPVKTSAEIVFLSTFKKPPAKTLDRKTGKKFREIRENHLNIFTRGLLS